MRLQSAALHYSSIAKALGVKQEQRMLGSYIADRAGANYAGVVLSQPPLLASGQTQLCGGGGRGGALLG